MLGSAPAQTSRKSCRTCDRRRILCDRALPTCKKCSIKGLECPGYAKQLRWTTAVNLRGPSKGLTPSEVAHLGKGLANSDSSQATRSPPLEAGPDVQPNPDSTILPFSDPVVGMLFQNYANNISPMMVWLDSDSNEYRRLVMPLAADHLALRLAVCAISAAHMPQEPDYGLQFSSDACETAITKVAEQVRYLLGRAIDGITIDKNDRSVEGTLATMLILANRSLFNSDPAQARSYRHDARILLETLSLNRSPTDELFVFLREQVALCDVLLCTTLFNSLDMETVIIPEHGRGDVILGHFLNIVHKITTRPVNSSRDEGVLGDIESSLEIARGWSLLVSGRMMNAAAEDQSFKEDYIRWIHIFHHAGMLYACKRLQLDAPQTEEYHTSRLLRELQQFHDINTVIHNLAWPIFVGGICVCRSWKGRIIISEVCGKMSTKTPFLHYARILTFLEELWGTPHQDWALLAREWEDRGEPLLAV